MKNLLLTIATLLVLAVSAVAQDKPSPTPAAPDSVTLSKEAVDKIELARLRADNQSLQAENLAQQIELAKARLEQLRKESERLISELKAEQDRQLLKAGIPSSALGDYEAGQRNPDGTLTITKRKPQPKP